MCTCYKNKNDIFTDFRCPSSTTRTVPGTSSCQASGLNRHATNHPTRTHCTLFRLSTTRIMCVIVAIKLAKQFLRFSRVKWYNLLAAISRFTQESATLLRSDESTLLLKIQSTWSVPIAGQRLLRAQPGIPTLLITTTLLVVGTTARILVRRLLLNFFRNIFLFSCLEPGNDVLRKDTASFGGKVSFCAHEKQTSQHKLFWARSSSAAAIIRCGAIYIDTQVVCKFRNTSINFNKISFHFHGGGTIQMQPSSKAFVIFSAVGQRV